MVQPSQICLRKSLDIRVYKRIISFLIKFLYSFNLTNYHWPSFFFLFFFFRLLLNECLKKVYFFYIWNDFSWRSGRQNVAHRMGMGHYKGPVKDARELLSRSEGSHRHSTNADHYHHYHSIHDDDDGGEEEEEDDDDEVQERGNYSSPYSTKSDLRAKLERRRMQLSSSSASSASLSSASGHYPRLKIEVLDWVHQPLTAPVPYAQSPPPTLFVLFYWLPQPPIWYFYIGISFFTLLSVSLSPPSLFFSPLFQPPSSFWFEIVSFRP